MELLNTGFQNQDIESYLNRDLSYQEKNLLEKIRTEKYMNHMMNQLYKRLELKKFYVPILTQANGDCLFQSLNYHKIGDNPKNIRNFLSFIIFIYKSTPNFLPHLAEPLEKIFENTNDIEFVACRKHTDIRDSYLYDKFVPKKFYKYNFDIMVQDLCNESSWCRLPTNLIFTIISYIFKVEIIIIHNGSDFENKINAWEDIPNKPEIKTIYIGQLSEYHYIPLEKLPDNQELIRNYYIDAHQEFDGLIKRERELAFLSKMRKLDLEDKPENKEDLVAKIA